MDNDKRFIGMYHSEAELMNKIEELKGEGWMDDNIYVLVKNKDELSMLRGRTTAEIQSADGSWWDRFMGFVSGEDHVHRMVEHLGFNASDTETYYREIENGGMLLYVDQGQLSTYYTDSPYGSAPADENLGANSLAADEAYRTGGTGAAAGTNAAGAYAGDTRRAQGSTLEEDEHIHSLNSDEETMKLREERLQVERERVNRGNVELTKDIVEEDQSVDVNVAHDEVYIERRPVTDGEAYDAGRITDADEETIRIPITEERIEVTKKPVVTEEIVLRKRQVEEQETIHETVKKEEAHLRKEGDIDVHGDRLDK